LGGGDDYIDQNPLNYFPQGRSSNSGVLTQLENLVQSILLYCGDGTVKVTQALDYPTVGTANQLLVPSQGIYSIQPNKPCWLKLLTDLGKSIAGSDQFPPQIARFIWVANKQNSIAASFPWITDRPHSPDWEAAAAQSTSKQAKKGEAEWYSWCLDDHGRAFFASNLHKITL